VTNSRSVTVPEGGGSQHRDVDVRGGLDEALFSWRCARKVDVEVKNVGPSQRFGWEVKGRRDRVVDRCRETAGGKALANLPASNLEAPRRIEGEAVDKSLGVPGKRDKLLMGGVRGVIRGDGEVERDQVKVPRVVLAARLERPNEREDGVAVQHSAEVARFLQRVDGGPVQARVNDGRVVINGAGREVLAAGRVDGAKRGGWQLAR
jgi:hypothetical protein